MQIVSLGDNLHEISNPIFRGKKKKWCLLKFLPSMPSIRNCEIMAVLTK